MALWIGLVLGWFVLALVGALALGRVLRGLDRPIRGARVSGLADGPEADARGAGASEGAGTVVDLTVVDVTGANVAPAAAGGTDAHAIVAGARSGSRGRSRPRRRSSPAA